MRSDGRPTETECDRATGSAVRLLDVPTLLEPYVASALIRLNYLYSDVHFAFERGHICVSNIENVEESRLRTEAAHALYREKIFAETLPLRKAMYARIFG